MSEKIKAALAAGQYTLWGSDDETYACTAYGWAKVQSPDLRPGENYMLGTIPLPPDLVEVQSVELTESISEMFSEEDCS